MKNKVFTVIFGVALFFFIITVSIAIPIYCRFIYYAEIKALNLESVTGYSYGTIKTAYDQVLNFLTLGAPFGTGELAYSESGMAHFYDCKVLFDLNFWVMTVSGLICLTLGLCAKRNVVQLSSRGKLPVYFYSALCAIVLPVVLGAVCAADFDAAFVTFHKIFFPGKTNWTFDPAVDEIIRILPQEFFMTCAIVIAAALLIIAGTLIAVAVIKTANEKKKS